MFLFFKRIGQAFMYIVQNITRNEVYLNDLRAIIFPGKQEDLDNFASRHVVEQSKDLRLALKRGGLRIVKKDNPNNGIIESGNNNPPPAQQSPEVIKAIADMEKRLTENFNLKISKHVDNPQQGGIDSESMQKLQDAINALQNIAVQGGSTAKSVDQENSYDEEDPNVVDIHQRSINRLTKDTKSHIQHKKEQGKSNADSNIEELEDLL